MLLMGMVVTDHALCAGGGEADGDMVAGTVVRVRPHRAARPGGISRTGRTSARCAFRVLPLLVALPRRSPPPTGSWPTAAPFALRALEARAVLAVPKRNPPP